MGPSVRRPCRARPTEGPLLGKTTGSVPPITQAGPHGAALSAEFSICPGRVLRPSRMPEVRFPASRTRPGRPCFFPRFPPRPWARGFFPDRADLPGGCEGTSPPPLHTAGPPAGGPAAGSAAGPIPSSSAVKTRGAAHVTPPTVGVGTRRFPACGRRTLGGAGRVPRELTDREEFSPRVWPRKPGPAGQRGVRRGVCSDKTVGPSSVHGRDLVSRSLLGLTNGSLL